MATKEYTGAAKAVADVWTLTIPAVLVVGETITITYTGLGNAAPVVTLTTTVLADAVAAVVNMWNALTDADGYGDMAEYTAAAGTSAGTVVFTHDDPGTSGGTFSVADTIASGNASFAHTTTATGPYFLNNALNWSGGTLPSAGDNLVLRQPGVHLRYELIDATDYANVYIYASFGEVGLADANRIGETAHDYPEWRQKYLKLGSSTAISYLIGVGDGEGSGLYRIDYESNTGSIWVYKTGGLDLDGQAACIIRGGSSATLVVFGGDVHAGRTLAETTSLSGPIISRGTEDESPETTVAFGQGVQVTGNVTVAGAAAFDWNPLISAASCTTMTIAAGASVTLRGNVAATTINNFGALIAANYGSVTTLRTFGPVGSLDLGDQLQSRGITTLEMYPGTSLVVPYGHQLTLGNNVKLKGGAKLGETVTYTGPPDITFDHDYP